MSFRHYDQIKTDLDKAKAEASVAQNKVVQFQNEMSRLAEAAAKAK
jgi:hypothetical protein